MLRTTVCCALLAVAAGSFAQSDVYRTTDENGNPVFSDAPPAGSQGAERVDIPPVNSVAPPPDIPARQPAAQMPEAPPSPVATITSPANETTIPMGPGNFSVSASVEPPLEDDQTLQLMLDGEPRGDGQRDTTWDLVNVFRGQHDITVAVIGSDGEKLSTSDPVRVYVLRPSINNRN